MHQGRQKRGDLLCRGLAQLLHRKPPLHLPHPSVNTKGVEKRCDGRWTAAPEHRQVWVAKDLGSCITGRTCCSCGCRTGVRDSASRCTASSAASGSLQSVALSNFIIHVLWPTQKRRLAQMSAFSSSERIQRKTVSNHNHNSHSFHRYAQVE